MAGQLSRRETGIRPWDNLREEMDQLFSRVFGGEEMAGGKLLSPSLDLSETDDEIEVRLDLPGFKPDEIDVDLNRNMLTISGEHKEEAEEKVEEKVEDRRYHRIERRRGSFRRTIALPATVQEDKVDASFSDGVLTITMPKADESKSRKIPVKG